jgi:hypothetical protein
MPVDESPGVEPAAARFVPQRKCPANELESLAREELCLGAVFGGEIESGRGYPRRYSRTVPRLQNPYEFMK